MSDADDIAFPGMEPPTPVAAAPAYRVLARKYRPGNFDALLGQEAMVRTLANAIARDRLAQAWLLTGVRGVGKTSTARIIAKALNCVGVDGSGGPTINPCGICEPCVAIAAGRHMDVIEMDAASNTGIDDIREIIEAVRYASASARYKIYIIDEVHMLSKPAFNGLLKTLEEPPPHVKFIFATTEVQKIPVTVLSRCQRFDLRRVSAETLTTHFAAIVKLEGAEAEPEALALIARAAEGSVRDGLSVLDQAIAHSAGVVTAAHIRDMLGLADRGLVRRLFGLVLAGDAAATLNAAAEQYDLGLDPENLLRELLELVHAITRARLAPADNPAKDSADDSADDPASSIEERTQLAGWAKGLGFPALHRLWQLLLKGLAEVQAAPVPLQAAEMALLRIIHASDLPDPAELVKRLTENGVTDGATARTASAAAGPTAAPQARAPAAPPAMALQAALPADFPALVSLFRDRIEPRLAHLLGDELRLVEFAPPLLTLAHDKRHGADQLARIGRLLATWTGQPWQVTLVNSGGGATLRETAQAVETERLAAAHADPVVALLLAEFPDARLIGVDMMEERIDHAQSR